LVWYFGISFDDVGLCTYVYGCKYHHELCYKDPLCSIMLLCCHVGLLLSRLIIVNIELSYKFALIVYFAYNNVVVIGIFEHQGRFSLKGEGSLTTLVKIPWNKSK